jgi:Transposase DDE domain
MREELISEDWDLVKRLLPDDWQASARQCGALRRSRNVDSAETLLRLILLHVAGGLSLRQTVVRAEALGWASLSDVALLKRLRASANWLESLCWGLWSSWDWPAGVAQGRRWRIVDATTAQEPGATGIDWRVHYVVGLPSLACEFVSVTSFRGAETLCRIPVRPTDVLLADRGYSHRAGVDWALSQQAAVIVRHQIPNFPLLDSQGRDFEVLSALRGLHQHEPGSWKVRFQYQDRTWAVWLHAVRKSAAAAQRAKETLRKEHGADVQAQTLELGEYVVVLTSLNPKAVSATAVLGLYRGRWQIELVFKRLKSLLGVGELAKYDEDSAKSWLQAKLLTALLMERLEREAFFFSPWGYPLPGTVELAGVSRSERQLSAGCGSRIVSEPIAKAWRNDETEATGTSSQTHGADESIS